MLVGRDIRLAQWERADVPLLNEWLSNADYRGPFYNIWTSSEAEWEASIAREVDESKQLSFLIRACDDDRPVGTIGYWTPFTLGTMHRALEIWYQVHPDERGKGVASQAAAILVDHLFSALPIERIQATVAAGNEGSGAVLRKIGMTEEGVLRHVFFLRGRYVDMELYSILRNEWESEEAYRTRFDFLR
jgi:[ribosomal protein S5]-alanine N-acetyltransferase